MTISQFRKYSAVPPKQRLCPGVGQNKLGSSRGCAKHGCVLWVIKEHKVHLQLGWGHGLCGTDVDTGKAEPGQRQLPAAVVFMEFDIQVEITRVEEEKSSKVHRVFGWLYLAKRIQNTVQINHQQSKLIAVCNSLAPSKDLRVLQIHILIMLSYKKE